MQIAEAVEAVRALSSNIVSLTGVGQTDIDVTAEGDVLIVQLSEPEREAVDLRTIQQSLEIIRTRVDQAGTREPTIQRQGADRILIQVPAAPQLADVVRALNALGATPQDLLAILQAIKAAGALNAELEVI